jgi:flagellar hook-associated protein 2
MGTISTGVGLISGMNIQDLVTKLMAIESKPLDLLKTQINTTNKQKLAYSDLSASILGIKAALTPLSQVGTFRTNKASSSNESVLTATATSTTPAGTYRFTVAGLASTHQLVSTGYTDRTSTVGAGTLTLETGKGYLSPATALSELNGGVGVRRGVIRITDRAGGTADVDLRTATDLNEVVNAINSQSSARIQASVEKGRLVLNDVSGSSSGNLTVADLGTGKEAADLGIAGTATTLTPNQIISKDLLYVTGSTSLARLNDGLGVRTNGYTDDFSITTRDGSTANVSLAKIATLSTPLNLLNDGNGVQTGSFKVTNSQGVSTEVQIDAGVKTIQDVVTKLTAAGVSVSMVNGKLSLSETSGGAGNFKIEEVGGNHVAADLGIKGDVAAGTSIQGTNVYRMDTVGTVISAINQFSGGKVTAAISGDGHGITLTDNTTGAGAMQVAALNGSKAAADLGILGSSTTNTLVGGYIMGGPNTVLLSSLNGGAGVSTGGLVLARQVGGATTQENINLQDVHTLSDVLNAINNHTVGGQKVFQASVSEGGTGITIQDIGNGQLTGASGQTATDLKLQAQGGKLAASDLQLRYISESTKLDSLNAGKGIPYGSFLITASDGHSATVTLSSALHQTIGQVISEINGLKYKDTNGNDVSLNVTARVNATGDGIELVDAANGTGTMSVTELSSGSTAADLGIKGSATGGVLTGTFAKSITIASGDTLDDVVAKINAAKAGVQANIINDGTSGSPYRLVLTSTSAGSAGRMNYSLSGSSLSFSSLAEPDDAKVVMGDLSSSASIVVSSATNTVSNIIDGLSLNLQSVGTGPVQVTVERDTEAATSGVDAFIKAFNAAIDKIDDQTSYNAESEEKGVLLGDSAVERVRSRLYSVVTASVNEPGMTYNSLSQLGIAVGSGGHLSLKYPDRLDKALAKDPQAVEKLFTLTTKDAAGKVVNKGIGVKLNAELDLLASSTGSVISQQQDSLQSKIDLFTKRSTDMQDILDAKEKRLYAQFQAMESALASLQSQQSALSSLSSLSSSMSSSGTTG